MTFILLSVLLFTSSYHEDHALYLSTLNISVEDISAEDAIVKAEIKVFEDDLRDVLRAENGKAVDTSSIEFTQQISSYFSNHIYISVNDKSLLSFDLVSANLVGDSYQILFVTQKKQEISNLKFRVDYFLELFPTQQNILHIVRGKKQWYHIFKKGNEQLSLDVSS